MKDKIPRPKKRKTIQVDLRTEELYKKIKALADKDKRPMSSYIRCIMERHVEEVDNVSQ